jgi:RNA polymerase sigma factor (TIGR02999 family)
MTPSPVPEITELLLAWSNGDEEALHHLMPLVHAELHRMARQRMRREDRRHTLQTTALVNEVYLRLVDQKRVRWQNRAHFFGIASRLMRRILVDHARRRRAQRRGGAVERLSIDESRAAARERPVDLLALDRALRSLEAMDPRQGRVVELKYFAGMTIAEIAEAMGLSPATVVREWSTAKAWLARELAGGSP